MSKFGPHDDLEIGGRIRRDVDEHVHRAFAELLAGLDVRGLLPRDVHRDERVEVEVGIDADGVRLLLGDRRRRLGSAAGAVAAPRQRDNVSGRIPRSMSEPPLLNFLICVDFAASFNSPCPPSESSGFYLRASFDARRSTNIGLVARFFERVPHDLLLVARHLRRPEIEGQLVDLPGELERQLVAVIHPGAAYRCRCRRSRRWPSGTQSSAGSTGGKPPCHPPRAPRCRPCRGRVHHI